MHELSIANSIVREVDAALQDRPDVQVTVVRLRIGRLSGIVAPALEFGLSFVTQGTRLDAARIEISEEPVAIWCSPCGTTQITDGPSVLCPACGTPSADIRAGRGMQIVNLDLSEPTVATTDLLEVADVSS
ncbi:MAG: hydrogenase maturation nickel metallochaperone HypA [Nitriliruptor sp.]|nr:MAG: hydrogenase maturation nickel metallochaperone HypA [Nitriliruptor sp.]